MSNNLTRVVVLDTLTKRYHEIVGVDLYQWTDGNWSCDCNRQPHGEEPDFETRTCNGCHRFIVVQCEFIGESCSIREMNSDYPKDVVDAAFEWLKNHPIKRNSSGEIEN